MVGLEHARHRVARPADWSVAELDCSLPERRACALHLACEQMPVAIEPDELIVGMRTIMPLPDETRPELVWMPTLPEFYRDDDEAARYDRGRAASHNVPGYANVIDCGLGGLADRARRRLADESDPIRRDHLRSFVIACEAAGVLSQRYADCAADLAGRTDDRGRRGELETIADVCGHIATGPPRNIHEALQLHRFVWLVTTLEVGCLVTSGRFDQLMGPFWPNDPDEQERARELIDCTIIKCNDQDDLWAGGSLVNNNLMLSGLTRDGVDGTNAVTWAVLDSVARLKLPDPQPAVRLHKGSPPELVRHIAELLRDGAAQICVFNDDAFVPALIGAGFPPADARDYAIDACQDINIAGKSDFYLAANIDLTDRLLETLEAIDDDADWQRFYQDYCDRTAAEIDARLTAYCQAVADRPGEPLPFLSAPMDDCIANGLDVANDGLRYRDKGVFLAAPVCAINSLAAIHQVVYVDGAATLAEVKAACRSDFADAEPLRRRLMAAPKWGNDDDAVDEIAVEFLARACREIIRHRIDDEAGFLAGIHQAHHVARGSGLGATPDGRHAGDPLSVTLAPANGTARKGPTAVMRSLTKIDSMWCQWNASLTMTFDPAPLAGEAGLEKFAMLITTYLAMGGLQLQVNCIGADTLRAAQKDPEAYDDLIVRVWGFCDRFVALSPEYQQELIDRTAYAV